MRNLFAFIALGTLATSTLLACGGATSANGNAMCPKSTQESDDQNKNESRSQLFAASEEEVKEETTDEKLFAVNKEDEEETTGSKFFAADENMQQKDMNDDSAMQKKNGSDAVKA